MNGLTILHYIGHLGLGDHFHPAGLQGQLSAGGGDVLLSKMAVKPMVNPQGVPTSLVSQSHQVGALFP